MFRHYCTPTETKLWADKHTTGMGIVRISGKQVPWKLARRRMLSVTCLYVPVVPNTGRRNRVYGLIQVSTHGTGTGTVATICTYCTHRNTTIDNTAPYTC